MITHRDDGEHIVERVGAGRTNINLIRRGTNSSVTGILVVEDAAARDLKTRRVHRIGGRMHGAVLLDHRELFPVAVVSDDVLLDGNELQ